MLTTVALPKELAVNQLSGWATCASPRSKSSSYLLLDAPAHTPKLIDRHKQPRAPSGLSQPSRRPNGFHFNGRPRVWRIIQSTLQVHNSPPESL